MIGNGLSAPLAGLRVIGLEQFLAGPYCSMMLADAGAEVIKIEPPRGGDPRRQLGPFATKEGRRIGGSFIEVNRNKKSVSLDLQKPAGRAVLLDLAKVSDVVVENMRPGTADRLGVGYEALRAVNPRLIYTAISGFGRLESMKGPYSERPAFDIVAEAMSGIMELVGFADREPSKTIIGMPDIYTGVIAAYGILLAVIQRGITGRGQLVDASMYDAMVTLNERSVFSYGLTGQVPTRGNEKTLAPHGAFKAKDGYVAMNMPTDDMWARLCRVIGREDLIDRPETSTGTARAQHMVDIVRPAIEVWLADKGKVEAAELLIANDVPVGQVQTMADVFACPQAKARKLLLDIVDDDGEHYTVARTPTVGSAMAEVPTVRPPRMGEHNEALLRDLLGYSAERVAELREERIIG